MHLMEQKLKHLRLPLAILAVAVMSACGKTPGPSGRHASCKNQRGQGA